MGHTPFRDFLSFLSIVSVVILRFNSSTLYKVNALCGSARKCAEKTIRATAPRVATSTQYWNWVIGNHMTLTFESLCVCISECVRVYVCRRGLTHRLHSRGQGVQGARPDYFQFNVTVVYKGQEFSFQSGLQGCFCVCVCVCV